MKRVLPALFLACAVGRLAAADFTVTNTNSSGPGSLYQAITDANNTPGADRILFNIPGAGVKKIDVSKNLLQRIEIRADGFVITVALRGGDAFVGKIHAGQRNAFALQ